ncbi:MAG: hypothetical protein ACTSWM_07820 [Alphaproteobacteria bacterium]
MTNNDATLIYCKATAKIGNEKTARPADLSAGGVIIKGSMSKLAARNLFEKTGCF